MPTDEIQSDEDLYQQAVALRDEIREDHAQTSKTDPTNLSVADVHGKLVDVLSFLNDLATVNAEALAPMAEGDVEDEDEEGDEEGGALDEDEAGLIIGLLTDHKASLELLRNASEDVAAREAFETRMADCDHAIEIVNDLVDDSTEQ